MAANHFTLCLCLFGLLFVTGLEQIGDTYYPEPWWHTGMQWVFNFLEAPVVAIVVLRHHAAPSSHPSYLLLLGVGIIWSLAVGYLYAFARQRFGVRARNDGQKH